MHEARLHGGQTSRAGIGGEDLRVREAMGEDKGLSSRCSAGVPYTLSGGRGGGSELGYEARAIVDLRERRVRFSAEERGHRRLRLACLAYLHRDRAAILSDPAFDEPLRVCEALGEGGGGFVQRSAWRLFASELAENGIDHSDSVRIAADARELDAFVNGGVRRDAVEVEKLEDTEAESDGDRLCKTLVRTLQKRLDAAVERDLPAERAHHKSSCEIAIFGGELCRVTGVQEVVAIAFVGSNKSEDLEGSGARGRDWFVGRLRQGSFFLVYRWAVVASCWKAYRALRDCPP